MFDKEKSIRNNNLSSSKSTINIFNKVPLYNQKLIPSKTKLNIFQK